VAVYLTGVETVLMKEAQRQRQRRRRGWWEIDSTRLDP